MTVQPLDAVRSVKVKLGLLVAASVAVASVIATIGSAAGVPIWLGIPVTIALALAVTQLLAVGMTSPLRQMTEAARRMATGDHSVRVTATSRDEVGELARAFNRMAEELAGVDRHRRELVANVSHELRTPLDAGKAPLKQEAVEVRPLLAAAVAEFGVGGRDVRYVVHVSPPDLVVQGDVARLRQLVANLLDNASRHSPPGGIVTIRAGVTDDRWHLEVADKGPGVAPADRERAFERFGTLSDIDGGGGTGLGLAIARWVTDLHDGSIGFANPGSGERGARIRADLPLVPTFARHKESPMTESAAAPMGRPTTAPPPPSPAVPSLTDTAFGDFWPDDSVPGNVRVLLAAVGVGVLAGLVLPFHNLGLGVFFVLVAAGGVLLAASRNRRDPFTLTCAALCLALSATVVIRDADWLVVLCLFTGAGLCAVGLVRGRSVLSFVLVGVAWPLAGLRGLPWLGRTLRMITGLGSGAALLRTVLWSVLGISVFALLFASADALFAEWAGAILPDVGSAEFALRVFVAVAIGGIVLAGAYLALNPPEVDRGERAVRPVAHRFEWLAPVLVVDAVFTVFLVAQATVIFGGHDYLRRTTGLTYAEYVHQGFGQLTVATALTLLVVWAASRKAPRETSADRAWIRGSLGVLCGLTLVVVASALYRMHVYQDAYGFTRLRLLVDVFEGWLGVLVLATLAGGAALRATWLPRFGLFSGVALLLALAAINPDAWIARQNIDRYQATGKVDWTYLGTLSDDAVPVLSTLPPDLAECALALDGRTRDDWLEWNLGHSRARTFIKTHADGWQHRDDCPGQTDR
jgi:two-component system sensor histidine kinase BaeS